ncbi:MAG: LamG domain-containing protein [Bdellovibrionota bacterium]
MVNAWLSFLVSFMMVFSINALASDSALDAALVAQYHLDEFDGATSFLDSSFSGNNGSCSGGTCPASGEMGVFGSAPRFDGTDDYIIVADNNNLDTTATLSIQIWFFPTTVDGQPDGLVSKRTTAGSQEAYSVFLYTSNRIYVDIDGSNNRFFASTTLSANRWYHVVVTYDGSQTAANRVRVYVNGREDSGSPFNETSTSIPNRSSALHIGMLNAAYGNGFHGLMDEVSIYTSVLSRADIENAFRAGAWRIHNEYLAHAFSFSDGLRHPSAHILSGLWRLFPRG